MPFSPPTLTATRWLGFKGSGRTRPALMGCDLPDGGEIECVVKIGGHKESAPHQPVCELVAALLAVDLGLPVVEPLLVEITPQFVTQAVPKSDAEAQTRLTHVTGFAFATRHLAAGYSILPVGKPPAQALLPSLAELYAFDGLIQNADRLPTNTNCLLKGTELRFFDHDQAFGFLLDLFGAGKVSQIESYKFMDKHLAWRHLARDRAQFNRIEGAWEAITDETIAGYQALIPDAWPGKKTYFGQIETHLKNIRTELATALDAITMSLPPS